MTEEVRKERKPPFTQSGILLVDKPSEWTSHDIVAYVRRAFKIDKVGHCGTLDPAATGLLILVFNKATKFSQILSGNDKTYECVMRLGIETDSYDMDGAVTAEKDYSSVTEQDIRNAVKKYTGRVMQIPPMVSAKKVGGKKLYELARAGKIIEREAVPIEIKSIEITKIELPDVHMKIECSKGTYVRSLCYDIGQTLGCGAVLFSLRRTRSGLFSIEEAVSMDKIKVITQKELEALMVDVQKMILAVKQ
ncbi:MAG TPA: tRNA pseudouridine(55) synthase TruB [Lentisphaeria bacterium]|nr:MAG: tRNA pseudouridine(55) synthase TruB [Lentisphaerae bacterium GWF2_38_69]HBM15062.1 tRNA pseudouridine(55) synthase TruB [Lentisphaeria bacterium]